MQIKTERLILTPLNLDYLASTNVYATDAENTKYMVYLPNKNIEETERFIRSAMAEWEKPQPQGYEFAVLLDGAHIGAVSLYRMEEGAGELGWILNKAYWGHGYATEAARGLMEYAKENWGIRRFIAQCDGENAASYRTMERLGMRRIGCAGGRKNRSSDEERLELTYEVLV